MALHAYFDASARPTGIFCVAGYAFAKDQVKKFEKEWSALFGPYGGCHMSELGQRRGRFKGIDDKEAERLMKGAVKTINRRISYGVVMSCVLRDFNALLPTRYKGFEHAFPVLCHLVMARLGMFITDTGPRESVSYFFESGDEYEGAARGFMERTRDVPQLKQSYQHESHAFVGKADAVALQAADFLAWEWAKYMDETVTQRKRLMRRSLIALMARNGDFDSRRYAGNHLTGPSLAKFCADVTELGLIQLAEEAEARYYERK